MKVTGYRLRLSAIIRGFMELADMALGEADAAVVSALWPSLCLLSTPASPPPVAVCKPQIVYLDGEFFRKKSSCRFLFLDDCKNSN